MLGTIVNTSTILLGSILGSVFKKGIKEKYQNIEIYFGIVPNNIKEFELIILKKYILNNLNTKLIKNLKDLKMNY